MTPLPPKFWGRDTHDWLRIESTAVAALFFFAFLVGPYRRWQTNPAVRFLHTAATAAAGTLFSQVLGMLNVFDDKAQFYLVWAVFLGVAFDTTVAATAYSIYELSAVRVAFEIGVLTNSANVSVLLGLASFEKFLGPLWALWVFTILKMFQRVLSFRAAAQTYGPENVDLVAHLMSDEFEHKTGTRTDAADPTTEMEHHYNYRVRGEDKVSYKYDGSSSNLKVVNEDDKKKIVTIDRVWNCQGRLLKDDDQEKRRIATRLKDVCLSFALFKLLRRRFRDYPAEGEGQRDAAKRLVLEKLLKEGSRRHCTRTFRVVQGELEFLHDLFYTKYPISFYRGVSVLNILQLLVIASSVWTATWVLNNSSDTSNKIKTDRILTFIFTVIVILMELWELINHVLSNWSKVLTTCNYVRHHRCRDRFHIDKLVAILGWFGTLWKPLSKQMGQYSLFQAYKTHSINSSLFKVFTSFMGEAEVGPGAKQSSPVKVTGDVQYAIFRALRDEHCSISNGERSLRRNGVYEHLAGACDEKSFERKILVWHIATSYFELETAAQDSTRTRTKKKINKVGAGEERSRYAYSHSDVAIRLSRYCAYLLLFAPDLLPVNNLVAKLMFEDVISVARRFFDKDVSWFDKLMSRETKKMHEKMRNLVPDENEDIVGSIMAEGLNLAKALKSITEVEVKESIEKPKEDEESNKEREEEAEEKRWKVLAEFWAEFLLFLAPSDNAVAHLGKLSNGGEFITHLWVLLYNAGILERPGPGPSAV